MLEVERLTKSYDGQVVLREISLEVESGVSVIIGVNGSGKSTLLKVIAGITNADAGRVFINGRDVTHLPPENRGVGYVPQHPALFNHLTTLDNITYSLRNGRGSREAVERIMSMLDLADVLEKKPRELSGGYKSRVSLARALVSQPRVMLLDEPLSDVDIATKEKLLPEFRDALSKSEIPVLYVTHDVQEAESLGDLFMVMTGGAITRIESAREAFDATRSPQLQTRLS